MRTLLFSVLTVVFFLACGTSCATDAASDETSEIGQHNTVGDTGIRQSIIREIQSIRIPSWIHVDSLTTYKMMPLSVEQSRELFPDNFEIMTYAQVSAFAKQESDSLNTGIWYLIKSSPPDEEESPETQDVVLVVYSAHGTATDAHYFATAGTGFGYSRIKADTIHEVFVDQMENVQVTTRSVILRNGHFEIQNEVLTSFGIGDTAYPASQLFIKSYFDSKN